jgi:lipopolysaccharide export system protein LptA
VHKLRFFLVLIFFPTLLFAQRSQIQLQSSEFANVDTKTNISYIKRPVFLHAGAILTCDSAVLYKDRNYFEAFKNVHINQGDTLNIYSQLLTYDGNTKQAHLSENVKLVDRTSTLTTNVLDYNLGTKYGTYVNGGKIVNKEATVTSKNGYYFANSKDAYFRYNVLVVTKQSTIKSDTLRYNTFTNWTYFYGPTDIKGKDDNLYTENGAYNTKDDNAYFGKKNLYTQGTKSLKGDSLFYNGKTGYGKAKRNIVFMDSQDKTLLRGQLGEYYKADERVVVTDHAYFAMGTKDSVMVNGKKMPDSLWLGADTLESQRALQKNLVLLNKPIVKKDNEVGAEDEAAKAAKEKEKAAARKQANSTKNSTKPGAIPNEAGDQKKMSRKDRKQAGQKDDPKKSAAPPPSKSTDSTKIKVDTVRTDTIKNIKITSVLPQAIAKKDSVTKTTKVSIDPKTKLPIANATKTAANVGLKKDTITVFNPADTVRTRVIKAFHNVRVFKSNLQAKADSLFYTAADSTLRWYKSPILWSDGTQQTGDTIHVFFKNDKVHSFQVFQNGFIVNVEGDSTKFNQVKGKRITGFMENGELRNVFVDGNSESMYYNKDAKGNLDNLSHSVSSRIKFTFYDKELAEVLTVKGNEGAVYPIDKLPKETTLTGFIWKPELRPTSKADIIKGRPKTTKKPSTGPKTNTNPKTGKPAPVKKSSPIVPEIQGPKKAVEEQKNETPKKAYTEKEVTNN